jgi:O-antigen/teichoic acid export membrane protein
MQAIQKIFKDSILIRSTAIVFISSTLVNILNYVFTIFVARNLSVENYGEVAALFSLLLIFSVPATALATHTIREVADKGRDTELLKNFQKTNLQEILVMAVSLWAVFLVFVPVIASALDIHVAYLLIFSLFLPLNLFTSYHTAFFQGKHDFLASSVIGFSSTVLKLVFAAIFIYFGFSVGGVLLALVLSFFASLFIYREAFVNFTFSVNFVNVYHKIIHVLKNQIVTTYFFAAFLLAVVSNIDVLLAKYFLDSFSAGAYGALSTLGKIVLGVIVC